MSKNQDALFIQKCYFDFRLWAEKVFGLQIKPFHIEWMKQVHRNRFNVIKAFRGSGKTTILGVVYPLWLSWFRPGTHILYTAAERDQAIKILDEVKNTIEDNKFLGDLMPDHKSTWKKTELKMTNGSRIYCKSYTRSIKGVHVDYVFCDEIQDCTDRKVFNQSIAPTVNQKKGSIVAVGTPDTPTDMLNELSERKGYVSKSYPILKKEGVSRWPEKFSVEEIDEIRKRDGERSFQTQYMMNCEVGAEDAVFPADWITNCFDKKEKFESEPIYEESIVVLGADFAISKGKRADFDAYVILEKLGEKSIIRFAERHKGLSKDAKIQRLKELYSRFKPRRMILDPSGIGEAVLEDLRKEALPVEEGKFHSRARNKLLINLVTMIQPDKNGESILVIPRNPESEMTLTFTNKLIEELMSFKEVKSKKSGMKSLVSTGAHDDTVMALALACKGASQQKEFADMVGI